MIHKIDLLDDHVLEISQDEDAESPDSWNNTDIFLVYDHRQFYIKREGYNPKDIFEYTSNIEQYKGSKFDNYFIFKVFAYIHSGVSLSLAHNGDVWDTSTTGYILVDKNDFDFDLQRKSIEELKDKSDFDIAKYYAEGLIDTWNTYLSGETYKYSIYKKLYYKKLYLRGTDSYIGETLYYDIEEVDSLCGFYGTNYKEILDHIEERYLDETIINKIKEISC